MKFQKFNNIKTKTNKYNKKLKKIYIKKKNNNQKEKKKNNNINFNK